MKSRSADICNEVSNTRSSNSQEMSQMKEDSRRLNYGREIRCMLPDRLPITALVEKFAYNFFRRYFGIHFSRLSQSNLFCSRSAHQQNIVTQTNNLQGQPLQSPLSPFLAPF